MSEAPKATLATERLGVLHPGSKLPQNNSLLCVFVFCARRKLRLPRRKPLVLVRRVNVAVDCATPSQDRHLICFIDLIPPYA
jgi:hypothetical protein